MDNIHNSNITKVPLDLITVNINGITAEYIMEKYKYAHFIDKIMLPESVVLHKNNNKKLSSKTSQSEIS